MHTRSLVRIVAASLLLIVSGQLQAQRKIRLDTSLDFNWRFHLGDVSGAQAPGFDDSAWRTLDVPHDWSIEGAYSQNNPGVAVSGWLPTGIGWYRRIIHVTPAMLERNVEVMFDGVFMDSTIWIDGHQLGNEPFGYMSFHYTLSPYLHAGDNVLAVRVDNLLQPAERWYTGSGIYGHVHLIETPRAHIPLWTTFVRTTSIDESGAAVAVSTRAEDVTPSMALRLTVLGPDGQEVAREATGRGVTALSLTQPATLHVPQPHLWSPSSPALYTLRVDLVDGTRLVDREETRFGIRSTRFDPARGFLLNGQVLKLRGVGDHLYGGPMGIAIPDAILERRLTLLKQMGVNAIRTSHNPHTPYFYELCDRMGILVMDEIYDGWHSKVKNDYAGRFFATQWHHDVERWVRRDRNHASVFIWSVGNETGLDDTYHMTQYVHSFDPSRPTTGGMMTTGVDVSGWNGPGEVAGVLEKFHADHPNVPIVLTEVPHTLQTRGYYRVRTWWRDWKDLQEFPPYGTQQIFFDGNQWFNSSYDNAIVRITARASLKRTESTPWIAGEFRWLGFDYLGEAAYKGGHWPARAENFGIIDLAGIPKDDYFLYQAAWTSAPMVHLLPHWTHPGMDGVVIPVVAYSNQPQVELLLNGKSLGRLGPGPLGDFLWKVPYAPGELRAVAYDTNGKQTAETKFDTAGDPVALQLTTDNKTLKINRLDDAVVTATINDQQGVMVPWAMSRIEFHIDGPVRLLGYDNGNPVDVTPNQASHRNAFYGIARGFYQAADSAGAVSITAASILGDPAISNTSPAHPRHVAICVATVALRGAIPVDRIEVHYTLDGSEPTAQSPLYTAPLAISDDTQVRAVVLRDGVELLHLSQAFHRVDDTTVSDPRWATDSQQDPLERGGRQELKHAERNSRQH